MEYIRFWVTVLSRAFGAGREVAEWIEFIFAVGFGTLLVNLLKARASGRIKWFLDWPVFSSGKRRIATVFLLVFVIHVFAIGPYLVYKDEQKVITDQNKILDDRARIRSIQDKLSGFLGEGIQLKERCSQPIVKDPALLEDVNKWCVRTATYLQQEMGQSYMIRIVDTSGYMTLNFGGIPEERQGLMNGINQRELRLNQFLQEISTK